MTTQLTEHFSLEELTFSQTALRLGIPNDPNADQLGNLHILCETLLEPARALLGVPFSVDSGFRSLPLNHAVGGARNSAHLDGRAADCKPQMDLQEAFDKLRHSDLVFDQIIFECHAWIHLAIAANGEEPRRQALTASGGPGHWSYTRV